MGPGPRVLVVCTANICRSPALAGLLAARLGPSIDVVSRGTRSVPGAGMCAVSAHWAQEHGADPAGAHDHLSRPLELADVKASTVILTATAAHLARVIELRPSAQVRTFTLLQAARIAQWRTAIGRPGAPAGADLPHRLLWLAEELDADRGAAERPPGGTGDDLPDPHHGGGHPQVLAALLGAVQAFCEPLFAQSAKAVELNNPRR